MGNKVTRKKFIQTALTVSGGLALGFGGISCNNEAPITGKIMGANAKTGHKLRQGNFGPVTAFANYDIVIIGGGIAGLSAARYLHSQGITNFILLDLENEAGGNSRSGENYVSKYPWGAHYLPIPGVEHAELISFLQEAGCITGYEKGIPIYNEMYLCHAPEERLFINGAWQNGLIPQLGNSDIDNSEFERFHILMESYKNAKGPNNKPLFALPVDDSDITDETKYLDSISFEEFLKQKGFTSEKLFWYTNYCCRDDYGTESKKTSAFAGIHYFAGRRGVAVNAENGDVLTWPEGNSFLAKKMQQNISKNILLNALAYKLELNEGGAYVYYLNNNSGSNTRISAKQVLLAVPQFVNKRLLQTINRPIDYNAFSYAPWMVANVTLKNILPERVDGLPLSWDNVMFNSKSLGYINACHQHTKLLRKQNVLTYYYPLCEESPVESRKNAYDKNIDYWQQLIIKDLKRPHPEIENCIENIDVWLWGHAMARPTIGFLTGDTRKKAKQHINNTLYFAHSDLGLPVFEEAFYQGLNAAKQILNNMKKMKKQAWIYSTLADGIFILLPPLLTLLVIVLLPEKTANSAVSPIMWLLLVVAIDVAHVYSSIYRTYFDPEMLNKHRSLLAYIPFIVFIIGVLFYSMGDIYFWRLLAYVAVFHFVRQQYGFMRIYSRKEVYNKTSSYIDGITIYASTIYPIIYWHLHPEKEFNWFVEGDFVYLNAHGAAIYFSILYWLIIGTYITKEIYLTIKHKAFSLPKNILMAGTALSWYFGIVYYNGDLAFTALNVISHGIPYMALVWFYGRKKYSDKNAVQTTKAPIGRIFTLAALPIFIGIILILAFVEEGLWDALVWAEHKTFFQAFSFLPHINSTRLLAFIVPLLTVPQFTHYVIDGFIWKIKTDNYNWKSSTLDK